MDITSYTFFSKLTRLPFVKRIYLFGSRVTGIHQNRADVDIAIECPTASDQQWNEILTIIDEADTLLQIDCVRFDAIQNERFRQSILRNHKILFDQGSDK